MAMLKSINRYSSAPLAPSPLPAGALMLVEINGQVFRVAAGPSVPTPPASGTATLTSTNGTLSWVTA